MKHFNSQNLPKAKALRRNMTPWEDRLRYQFLRLYPVKFRRQYPVGHFILDFYCPKAKLCIELDGGGHYEPEQLKYDAARTAALEQLSITVLRYPNCDVDQHFREVCDSIHRAVQQRLVPTDTHSP